MGAYPERTAGPFTESGGEVRLFKQELGWLPNGGVFTEHQIQVHNMGVGSAVLHVLGPANEWDVHTAGLANNDVVVVSGWYPGFKVVFTGTGGVAKVTAKGRIKVNG